MAKAKDIKLDFISARAAREIIKKYHYSGSFVNNSIINLGVSIDGLLLGAIQLGSPTDQSKILPLVVGTRSREMLEINRMAFSPLLPRNSESRALAVMFRILKAEYPFIKWVLTFADACQCGDGTIYRAAGFKLIGIKKNTSMLVSPRGDFIHKLGLGADVNSLRVRKFLSGLGLKPATYSMQELRELGVKIVDGYMLKYIYFLDKALEKNLTVPYLPFSDINNYNAAMYRGTSRPKQPNVDTLDNGTGQNRSGRSNINEVANA